MSDLTKVPEEAGKIVAMILFKDQVIVAAEYRVYYLKQGVVSDSLCPIRFESENGNQ
jgi:hypothetical protein